MPLRLGGPWIGCFAHGNIRYARFDHLKLGELTYMGDNWRQWFLERITFAPLSWYAWITLACLSCIRRAAMMRDLFSLFDLFNSYTMIFLIVLHLVFFVVIAPVIPKLKKKERPITLLMKISAWCSESYSMLHYILSICMLGICGLYHCSLQTAFTSFIEWINHRSSKWVIEI